MKNKSIKIYDGKNYCIVGACPIVEYFPSKRTVKMSDPEKSENGQFIMDVIEYNSLIKNAKIIER